MAFKYKTNRYFTMYVLSFPQSQGICVASKHLHWVAVQFASTLSSIFLHKRFEDAQARFPENISINVQDEWVNVAFFLEDSLSLCIVLLWILSEVTEKGVCHRDVEGDDDFFWPMKVTFWILYTTFTTSSGMLPTFVRWKTLVSLLLMWAVMTELTTLWKIVPIAIGWST